MTFIESATVYAILSCTIVVASECVSPTLRLAVHVRVALAAGVPLRSQLQVIVRLKVFAAIDILRSL